VDLRIDTGLSLEDAGALHSGVSVWLPPVPEQAPAVWVCLAGGNMNRRYFDLRPPGSDDLSYSFAAQMTVRGFIVVAIDHLGLGDSSKPEDGWQLTPELLTQANAAVSKQVLAMLREGGLDESLGPLPQLRSLGLGHSMGAMMTVLQQHAAHQHAGIALLGFSTRGLPEYAPAAFKDLEDPLQARPQLVEVARQMFGKPYPVIRSSGGNNAELYGSARAEPDGVAALKAATDCLLPVPATLSMCPGNIAPEAAAIEVPVFLGLGERDMAGPPHRIPAAFSGSRDVTLHIAAETGHSHFLFPSRSLLFDRLAHWARGVLVAD
jgi:pimeloyl-ACP methyl ester carboxylesterase